MSFGAIMDRKIILLSDGTGNSAAKVWRTNVWRVYESLDLAGSDQVAFYDDGVGSSSRDGRQKASCSSVTVQDLTSSGVACSLTKHELSSIIDPAVQDPS
jgi:uncharacterized protein (DUF2235 family)